MYTLFNLFFGNFCLHWVSICVEVMNIILPVLFLPVLFSPILPVLDSTFLLHNKKLVATLKVTLIKLLLE